MWPFIMEVLMFMVMFWCGFFFHMYIFKRPIQRRSRIVPRKEHKGYRCIHGMDGASVRWGKLRHAKCEPCKDMDSWGE